MADDMARQFPLSDAALQAVQTDAPVFAGKFTCLAGDYDVWVTATKRESTGQETGSVSGEGQGQEAAEDTQGDSALQDDYIDGDGEEAEEASGE